MKLAKEKMAKIVQEYSVLDPLEAYYRSYQVSSHLLNPFPYHTETILAGAMTTDFRVLDIGCGNGHTLIKFAHLFGEGIGIDESTYIIAQANRAVAEASINNVQFLTEKAINLPFDNNLFDFVFSERGPLGHSDDTLEEAKRVLKPGGRLFIETIGSYAYDEVPKQDTLLTTLDTERDRFRRIGIEPMLLMSHVSTLQFESVYTWFEYHCAIERYFGRPQPEVSNDAFIQAFVERAVDKIDKPVLTNHHIWVGGVLA